MLNQKIIEKYRDIKRLDFSYQVTSFNEFAQAMDKLLAIHEIDFKYQKKNCKRSGAAVLKKNLNTGEQKYTILIDKESGPHAKMNIFTHELMHIILDHHLKKKDNNFYLPLRAREFVVDYLAEVFVYSLTGLKVNDYVQEYRQPQNAINYRENWLKDARLSTKTIEIINMQIIYGCELLSDFIKENYND